MEMNIFSLMILLLAVPASFVLSSAAGLGGSLILVPALAMVFGIKEGVAMAALLLAANNLAKLAAYRLTLPVKQSISIAFAVMIGAATGAILMVNAPEFWVKIAVIAAFALTFAMDLLPIRPVKKVWAGCLAFASGATSGFSGTSGPLKGVAIRSLTLERQYFVGAAAIVSLAGDMTKAIVFTQSGLLGQTELIVALVLIPVMIVCTLMGRQVNQRIGEQGYTLLFWTMMSAYTMRLVLT